MSKKKTSTFYLTERVTMTATGTPVTATIDLGAYVDVADRQAIAIEEVDYIWQGTTPDFEVAASLNSNNEAFVQLFDLNRGGTIQFADDRALVSSGGIRVDGQNGISNAQDMYPDVFGARDGVRLVVNDQLYITAEASNIESNQALNCTVRVKAHVAGLTAKDWMAIAIQSTAADN